MMSQSPNAEALKRLANIRAAIQTCYPEPFANLPDVALELCDLARTSLEAEQLLVEALTKIEKYTHGPCTKAEASQALANHAKLRGSQE